MNASDNSIWHFTVPLDEAPPHVKKRAPGLYELMRRAGAKPGDPMEVSKEVRLDNGRIIVVPCTVEEVRK